MTAPHINTVRQHLLDQMQALRTAKPGDIKTELARAHGISELAQVAVNTAKVEVDYLRATKQESAPFMEAPPDPRYITDEKGSGYTQGDIERRPGVTVHKLRG